MNESKLPLQSNLNNTVCNVFEEHSLFAINRNAFKETDASTLFRSHFGDSLFEENTFYVIAGTDSGLLYQYVKAQSPPKNSRYLFVELPQVLERLVGMDDSKKQLFITTLDNWQTQAAKDLNMPDYLIQDKLVLIRSLGVVHSHYPPYGPLWKELREAFDLTRKRYITGINNRPFAMRQLENMTENQTPAICLKDAFIGKTAVVLAGGPSLSELLPWVRQHRNNLLVIAVSRISNSLIKAGIQPDISVSVDPYHVNLSVSRETFEFQEGTVLLNEYHLNSMMLSNWGGKKIFMGRRYPWSTSLEPENIPSSPGNTVTNTALFFAVETGVSQIILGGADFCFSPTGHTHASGSAEHALGSQPMYGDRRVKTNGGVLADTDKTFIDCATVIELQTQEAITKGCRVINPSPSSMRLSHVEHFSTEDILIEPLAKSAQETIASRIPDDNSHIRCQYYEELLKETSRVLTEIENIKSLSKDALNYSQKLSTDKEIKNRFKHNSKINEIEKQLNKRYISAIKFIKYFNLKRFIPILNQNKLDRKNINKNDQLYFQAFIDSSNDIIELIDTTQQRILSRIEENSPKPNIKKLLKQWRHDKHPGRAIHWEKNHLDYVKKLPEIDQMALHEFQYSFESSIDIIAEHHQKNIETLSKLDGMNSRAREYFQRKDSDGLKSLITSLNEYKDKEQADFFLPLVQGYLAEIEDKTNTAIDFYHKTPKGPAHIDSLIRLFDIYTKEEDIDAALKALETLSNISSTYSPMYADMLQASGDVNNAVEIYTDYLLDNPDDLISMMKLGKIYYQHGAKESVEWAMNYILSKDPNNHTAKAMLESSEQIKTDSE